MALHIDFVGENDEDEPGGSSQTEIIDDGNAKTDPEKDKENTEIEQNGENNGIEYNLADYLYKDIYIDGAHINNWNLSWPVTVIDGKIFIPMTEGFQKVLGFTADFDGENRAVVFKPAKRIAELPSLLAGKTDVIKTALNDGNCACNLQYLEVLWGQSFTFNGEEAPENSAAVSKNVGADGRRMLYVSLDALPLYANAELSHTYDEIGGLAVSSYPQVDAVAYLDDNNKAYIEGRARFMIKVCNVPLDFDTAVMYEYIFRHEAAQQSYISEDLLMAMVYGESRFNTQATSRVNAIGLTQILYKYAEGSGYSEEMLKDPHYNVEYGAAVLQDSFERCNGDAILSLTAYNMGYYGLMGKIARGESYSTNYADLCIKRENMLKSYLEENGYAVSFRE